MCFRRQMNWVTSIPHTLMERINKYLVNIRWIHCSVSCIESSVLSLKIHSEAQTVYPSSAAQVTFLVTHFTLYYVLGKCCSEHRQCLIEMWLADFIFAPLPVSWHTKHAAIWSPGIKKSIFTVAFCQSTNAI